MDQKSQIEILAHGTSEGVQKAWLVRARRAQEIVEGAGYKSVIHREKNFESGVRRAEPALIDTYAHPDKRRITLYTGPKPDDNSWAHQDRKGKITTGDFRNLGELRQAVGDVKADAAGGQTDSSSFIGRKYKVQDHPGYGHFIGEYDDPEEAEHAARTRPYSRVISWPEPTKTPAVRDMARARQVKTNPDIDS